MNRPILLLAATLVLATGCTREEVAERESASTAAAPPGMAATAEALDRMDTRTPVPMVPMMAQHQKENMRDHLLAVQEIIVALASDDFAAAERAAARIGFSEETGQMCTHMGSAAPGFTDQALAFHHTADKIAIAARDRDRGRVLLELGATLETCTSCHSIWKQQVVDEATWQGLTSTRPMADKTPP